MNTQRLIQSVLLTGVGILFCNWGMPANANTARGNIGNSSGSEIVGGFQPNSLSGSSSNFSQTLAGKTAIDAIAALSQGNSFAFQTGNGTTATVSFSTTTSGGVESTVMKLNLPSADGKSFSTKEFTVANRPAAARIGAVIAGVVKGMEGADIASIDATVTLASELSSVESGNLGQANSSISGRLASQLSSLLMVMNKLAQPGQEKNKSAIANAIAIYNDLVNSSSPEMLVTLSKQPAFQAIGDQLRALRSGLK